MYVDHVQIQDLRCFEDARVEFVHPDADAQRELSNVTVLLGNNGAGKSTVLRALALGTVTVAMTQGGYVPYSMVRRSARAVVKSASVHAQVVVHGQDLTGELSGSGSARWNTETIIARVGDVERIESVFDLAPKGRSNSDHFFIEDSAGILVLGYGATRRVDPASEFSPRRRRKQRMLRYERVSSLFEEQVALAPLSGWLPELERGKPKLHRRVCELIDALIPADTRFTGELDGDEYLFERGGVKVGFAALSDGYRGYVGLLGDLFYHLCTGLRDDDDPVDSRGIVLVDEIGLHLHPAWQRVVVPTLARTLPRLQFVLTTHSPIIAGTLYAENLRLLEVDEHGLSHVEALDEEIHGLNADQILLTEAFGLVSSRAPDFAARYEQLQKSLDPEDWKDSLRLMRMYNRGGAGEADTSLPDAPPWAEEAASELAKMLGGDAPKTKPSKKKPAKKKSAKKK